jgi:HlyD family secretion protein
MKNRYFIFLFASLLWITSCGKKTEQTSPTTKEIQETVFASGTLEADHMYNLTAQTDGYLITLNLEEGDIVQKGKLIAVVENKEAAVNASNAQQLLDIAESNAKSSAPLLMQAQANIEILKKRMEQEALQEQRYKRLLDQNSIARVDYESVLLNYKNAVTNYDNAIENYNKIKTDASQTVINSKTQKALVAVSNAKNKIFALAGGRVYQKLKSLGDFVKRGETIAVIGDAKNIYAKINVDESNIAKLSLQQDATIVLNTQKDKPYKAKLTEISPKYDDRSRSYTCELSFVDTLQFRIVGTPLQSNIILGKSRTALLIPKKYLDFSNKVQIKGQKEKTAITTRVIGSDWVEVINGLTPNDIIICEIQ